MATKTLKYKLTDKAYDSVTSNTKSGDGLFIQATKGNKSKSLVMITENPRQLFYTVPIIHKNELFVNTLPEPASLFFNQAEQFSMAVDSLLEKFPENKTAELKTDGDTIFIVKKELYETLLSYKIAALTSIIMFLECFLNGIIPENFEIENSRKKIVGKKDIERNWKLKDKLKMVIPKIVTIANIEEYQAAYGKVIEINILRNEFIHMKTTKDEKKPDPFIIHFEQLINLKLNNTLDDFKKLVKIIQPDYFK